MTDGPSSGREMVKQTVIKGYVVINSKYHKICYPSQSHQDFIL